MRLGGPIFGDTSTPEKWIALVREKGYRAAYCPVKADASAEVIAAYAQAAREADIVIAEVGAWSNPISPDEDTRQKAIAHCQAQLRLADQIGALVLRQHRRFTQSGTMGRPAPRQSHGRNL